MREVLKRNNVINLFTIPSASITIISTKEIKKVDDLKGLKMRAPNPLLIKFLGALGSSNVHVATGEVYQALQLGVIDGVASTTNTYLLRKWHEPAKYFLNVPLGLQPHYAIMNLDRWNKMPKDIQMLFLNIGKQIETELFQTTKAADDDVRKKLADLLEENLLSPDEYDKWSDIGQKVWNEWADQGVEYMKALNLAKKITGK
jgi:TRAP-type C4-dicarboxylate transport system substrate-binding protein